MFIHSKVVRSITIVSIMVASLVALVIPSGQVFAMSPADDSAPPQTIPLPEGVDEKIDHATLGRLFQREVLNHELQQDAIARADKAGDKLSEMIARAKANGKDTSGLEAALAEFNTKLGEARLIHDQTGKLIKQHEGFDDQNKVTDAEKAKLTLEAVRDGNKEVRQILTQALKSLRDAGKEFRKANPRPTLQPGKNPA